MVMDSSVWYGFATNFISNQVYRTRFEIEDCGASMPYSGDFEPQGVSFATSGERVITLISFLESGEIDVFSRSITVTTDTAPDIDFSFDNSRCILNPTQFTSINSSGDINTYSWDFDQDGIEDSNQPNPTFQFPNAGTFLVTLQVQSVVGCTNSVSQEITLFDEPQASFSLEGDTICSGAPIQFNNTSTFLPADTSILSFLWDFNGEGTSTEANPSFTFSNGGSKTVTLTVSIPGCSTTFSQSMNVFEGPTVGFSFFNNCFGDSIQFNNLTTGDNITSILWDFGDGSTSSLENPSHLYLTTGTFTVSLTVTNVEGCNNTISQEITYTDAPLADFEFDGNGVGTTIEFTGLDLTQEADSIIDWQWDFGGLGSASGPFTSFVFANAGEFIVTLNTLTAQGCDFIVIDTIEVFPVLSPQTLFSVVDNDLCIGETLQLQNESLNASEFSWDFCVGDLSVSPEATALLTDNILNRPFTIEVIESNDLWFGFAPSRNGNNILRLDFGSSPNNIPQIVDLGDFGVNLDGPVGISFIEDFGEWHAFVITLDNSSVFRLDFGDSLASDPVATQLNSVTSLSNPDGITILRDSIFFKGVLVNGNDVSVLDFGTSITSEPIVSSFTVNNADRLWDVSLINENGEWIGLLSDFDNGNLFHLNFGSSINNTPQIEELTLPFALGSSADNELLLEGFDYFGFVQLRDGRLIRLEFGESLSNAPSFTDLGNFGLFGANGGGLSMVLDSSIWYGFSTDFTANDIYRTQFELDNCGANISGSTDFEPISVSFNTPGEQIITLRSRNDSGVETSFSQTTQITTDVAPDIDFSIDDSRCVENVNVFTSINNSGDIINFSWDFDGDGIEDSNDPDPEFQFSNSGTFTVSLMVESSAGCNNTITQELTVFDEPQASFVVPSDTLCTNSPILFTNTTTPLPNDLGIIEYEWDFNGEGSSTEENPNFSFVNGGDKMVTLTVRIPGCETTFSQMMNVVEGPAVDFDVQNTCEGDITAFQNLTSGAGITSFIWDFGDGTTSTVESPNHLFTSTGLFDVNLTVTNNEGCENTLTQQVLISSLPVVNFTNDLPCTESSIQFFDQSTVQDANIVSQTWEVTQESNGNTLGQMTGPNPSFQFPEPGDYRVSLTVFSTFGCQNTLESIITVFPSPQADFSIDVGCIGEPTQFTDLSTTDGITIVSRLWNINGQVFTEANPAVVFDQSGIFPVTLIVTNENSCEQSISGQVVVDPNPVVDFVFNDVCVGDPLILTDQSTSVQSITSRRWVVDGQEFLDIEELSVIIEEAGTVEATLEVTVESGCIISSTQNIVITPQPSASFAPSTQFGAPPLSVSFSNTSSNASSFLWQFGDAAQNTSTEFSPTFIYNEPGQFTAQLIASNAIGCADTTTTIINVDFPRYDVELTRFVAVPNEENLQLIISIRNAGSLIVDDLDIEIGIREQLCTS